MYYPKNKILEGLYTQGGEFKYKSDNQEYVGYYHKFYNGKLFTGKTNKQSPKQEIIPVISSLNSGNEKLYILDTDTKIALFLKDPDPIVDTESWNQAEIVQYLKIKSLATNEDRPRKVPYTHYPQPNEEDYENTFIIRYFVMKINEQDSFMEINKGVYDKLQKNDKNWMWDRYVTFNIVWTIVGETKAQVSEINNNVVYLKQRNIRRNGLIAYLRGNFSKFFKSKSQLQYEKAPPPPPNAPVVVPPNATPIPPTAEKIRSKKFFKKKRSLEEAEALELNRELQQNGGKYNPNEELDLKPFDGTEITSSLETPTNPIANPPNIQNPTSTQY
tara:strand:- start:100 stop:1089 length:990 start_codon:yes stop_codon:yes gene_type:complete